MSGWKNQKRFLSGMSCRMQDTVSSLGPLAFGVKKRVHRGRMSEHVEESRNSVAGRGKPEGTVRNQVEKGSWDQTGESSKIAYTMNLYKIQI